MRGCRRILTGVAAIGLATAAGHAQFVFSSLDYPTLPQPKGLTVGDFDGNGSIDVAVTASDQAGVLLNAGDGTFGAATNFELGGEGASHLIAAKLDSDGDLDLAMLLSVSNQVRVMKNAGDGTFVQGALINVGDMPTWMIGFAADGDTDVDLAVVNTGAGSMTILFNDGEGGYPDGTTYPLGEDPRSVAAADIDGDGDMDLAVTQRTNRTVATFLNDGSGLFTFGQDMIVGGKVFPEAVTAADFDGDKDADLAVTASLEDGPNLVVVFKNNGGVYGPREQYAVGALDPGALIASDINGDTKLDVATVARASDKVSILAGHGDATFAEPQVFGVGDNPRRIRSADFTGDDKLDLVVTNRDSGTITVMTNEGVAGDCLADLDGNGSLEFFDFLTFQNLFNAQDPRADCEADGVFDLFDFLCFQNLFVQGCK